MTRDNPLRRFSSMMTLVLFLVSSVQGFAQERKFGFSARAAKAQSEIESKFKAIPSPDEARKHHRFFTAEPHPAGSERNNELARYIAELWKQQGWEDITLRRYDVLNTFPREVSVEMTAPVRYKATLREDPYDVDPDTKNPRVQSAYTGLSASGEVTAPVVYAHSGNPEDYDLLRKHGIDVKGKIVLVRYSNPYSYRGFKALTAEREGAAAMIVYSDPQEDGHKRGKVFPDGPWGPESHIQRGAITYDFIVPGDPLTPGWASIEGTKRISIEQAVSLPKIIALPMSWRDAKPILENIGGPEAPKGWQGGLPIKYRLGGAATLHVKVDMDNSVKPNYVVEARIRGSEFPDEWIVLGNHRDAWEFGGVDPSSGTASMIEMSRAFGELKKQGIRPRRTIVICSWDGEEVGLTGSTEWGEQFADDLKSKAVAYINVDSSASGPDFRPDAVASLAPLVVEVSRSLDAPSGKSLYEELKASKKRAGKNASDSRLVDTRIGSGSDHTVFLNHLGCPTIGLTFDGPYGVYHSVYDDFYWMNQFGDPGYRYHTLMSKLWGVLALRLANAEILPFDFAFYADNLKQFVEELQKKPDARQRFDFKPLLRLVAEFEAEGRKLNQSILRRLASGAVEGDLSQRVNRAIMQTERNWLNPDGIPGRAWFKHILYAARYTYAHLELPGLTEAIERGDWKAAGEQGKILEDAITKNTALLGSARAELGK
ncbi:MAG TPA: M28 family metallopeptidase [Blastocatellia bacterium]|nr:M28 family metallopeptidase [Blastocatellia bacterium]